MVVGIPDIILTFAVLYILAVIVKRIVEYLFSESEVQAFICFFNNKGKIEKEKRIIENRKELIKSTINASSSIEEKKGEIEKLEDVIYKHENVKRREEKKRRNYLWGIGLIFSCVICLILCFGFDIKLIKILELNKCFDFTVSVLFISSGTKPLHDILMMLEKFKPK